MNGPKDLTECLPGIEIEITDKSRTELRQSLAQKFDEPALLNLDNFPQTTAPYISISHTKGHSGWVSYHLPIGFDMELSDRTPELKTINRVSTAEEVQAAPGPLALWVAKEAAFKSLWRSNQPPVISQIQVLEWTRIRPMLFSFKFSNSSYLEHLHSGYIHSGDRFTLGIALATP